MAESTRKIPLIAVDSNVLIDRAADNELVIDALDTLGRRIRFVQFVVTPTVIEEIALKAERGETAQDRHLAQRVLSSLVQPWGFRAVSFIPVGRSVVAEIARDIRREGIIPDNEVNDSLIVAEAALLGVTLLLSSDSHIKDIEYSRLKLLLDAADVDAPLIALPYKIVHQFF